MPPHRHAYRPTVMGARGVVTSAHPLASMAGIQMLQAGGNAVDAAVAVGSTLNVVEPFMSSAGGIGLMLISRRSTGERHVLDFIGRVRVYRDRLIDAESRIPAETRSGLAERGHDVNLIDDWSWIVGGGQGIVRDPESGALMAGADRKSVV